MRLWLRGEAVRDHLATLRALGAQISLDDFGAGYSSLSYLRRLPLAVLKVDRAFVQGLDQAHPHLRQDQAVVRAIVDMAHALEMEVVAEGVETDAQREALRRLGCDYMQGFLFSRRSRRSVWKSCCGPQTSANPRRLDPGRLLIGCYSTSAWR